jgi:predicted DNA-binding ribbon-helix-helix protein
MARDIPTDLDDDADRLEMRHYRFHGHTRPIALEPAFWEAFDDICSREATVAEGVLSGISERDRKSGLPDAIRVFVIGYFHEASNASLFNERKEDILTLALNAVGRPID